MVSTGTIYLLAVLLVASNWGLWLGLPTAVAGALAWNFFHIPPTGKLSIAEGENWVALVVFLVAAGVVSTLAGLARSRAEEAERRRREADLSAEMARLLLGGESVEGSLRAAGHRIAQALELPSVAIELSWVDSDSRRRAVPLIVDGSRIGTVLVPADTDREVLDALQDRVVPGLETLVAAVRRRDELESQVIETKALRRSNVVKTTLLRSVSHDLRSPLTAITAAADGLTSDTLSEESRARAGVGDPHRERSPLAPGGQPAGPHPPSGREHRAPPGLDRPRRGGAGRGREPGAAAGRVRYPDRCRPAAPERRRSPARTRDRERARERRPLCRRPAGGGSRPHGGSQRDAAHLRPRPRHPAWGPGAGVRALPPLPGGGRRGLGPRARDRPRLPGGQRWPHPGRVASGPGHDLRDLPAGTRPGTRRT